MMTATLFYVKESAELGDERAQGLMRKCVRAHFLSHGLPDANEAEKSWEARRDKRELS